jgi:NAD(P)H dehydrogenase (quinone)
MNHYEIAQVFSDTLGRPVTYEPIQIEEFAALLRDRGYSPNLIQHVTEVAVDYRNGIFAGTNDLTESIGQAKPTTVEDFINANMKYFTPS